MHIHFVFNLLHPIIVDHGHDRQAAGANKYEKFLGIHVSTGAVKNGYEPLSKNI